MQSFDQLYNAVMTAAKRKQSPKDVIGSVTQQLDTADRAVALWNSEHHWGAIGLIIGGKVAYMIVLKGQQACTEVRITYTTLVRGQMRNVTEDVDRASELYLAFAA